MWNDPEKEKQSGVAWELVCRKWVQAKGWMVSSSVGQEQGAGTSH